MKKIPKKTNKNKKTTMQKLDFSCGTARAFRNNFKEYYK